MDIFAMYIGYTIMGISAVLAVSGLIIGSCMLFNKAIWMIVKSNGGLAVFNEYRRWLRSIDRKG